MGVLLEISPNSSVTCTAEESRRHFQKLSWKSLVSPMPAQPTSMWSLLFAAVMKHLWNGSRKSFATGCMTHTEPFTQRLGRKFSSTNGLSVKRQKRRSLPGCLPQRLFVRSTHEMAVAPVMERGNRNLTATPFGGDRCTQAKRGTTNPRIRHPSTRLRRATNRHACVYGIQRAWTEPSAK